MTRPVSSFWIVLLVTALWIGACAADPDADQPGTCSLSCSGAKMGDFSYSIATLTTSVTANCPVGATTAVEASAPVTLKWRIFEEDFVPMTPIDGNGRPVGDTTPYDLPRSGIRFEPIVNGSVWMPRTNPEHLDANQNPTPAKYGGVVTSLEEWCTDSCGIATVEVWPACGSTNAINVMILSGAMDTSDSEIKISY